MGDRAVLYQRSLHHKIVYTMADTESEYHDLTKSYCAAELLMTCHFSDKPSKTPCPDSPVIVQINKQGALVISDYPKCSNDTTYMVILI